MEVYRNRHASITGKGCSGRWHTLTRSPASVESYLPVRCLVPVERKRTHLPENDEEASDRAPMHFEIFPRVVQYRRSVSVAAGESSEISVDRICMRGDSRGILSGNMVGWQKFTRHLDKILHDRRQKLALMPRQMNGILKRKIRKIDPGNGN